MTDTPRLWDRLTAESPKSYAAFRAYVALGVRRSVREAARQYHSNRGNAIGGEEPSRRRARASRGPQGRQGPCGEAVCIEAIRHREKRGSGTLGAHPSLRTRTRTTRRPGPRHASERRSYSARRARQRRSSQEALQTRSFPSRSRTWSKLGRTTVRQKPPPESWSHRRS